MQEALERQRAESVKVAEARAQAELLTKAAEEQAAQTRLLAEEQVHIIKSHVPQCRCCFFFFF